MIELIKKYAHLTNNKFTYIMDQWGRGEVILMNGTQAAFNAAAREAGYDPMKQVKPVIKAISLRRKKEVFGIFFNS